ncbi:MAG: GspMb/PilO family protein [Verrucomicrobiales bacterium]|nr:GspMb/PilO family protein [Verrucomicrobiales bacterium]
MTSREKKLGIAFAILFAVVTVGFIAPMISRMGKGGSSDPSELLEQLQYMRSTFDARELWNDREFWLDGNTPYHQSDVVASSVLLERLSGILESHDLKVVNQQIAEDDDDAISEEAEIQHFNQVTVQIVAEGEMRDIVQCIHEIQTPKKFTGIEELELTVAEAGAYRIDLRVTHWFSVF